MERTHLISPFIKLFSRVLVIIGIICIGLGFYFDPDKTWANFLLNNYYFTSIVIGATFFLALQYITQSGWSAMFIRVPLAIARFLPVTAILFMFLIFGMHSLYEWSHPQAQLVDPMIIHKFPYLNVPFFFIRLILFFTIWIFMTYLLRRTSLREEYHKDIKYFNESEFYSKIYIFVLALTFSLVTFDLIMSIDVHWFSTIFAIKNFVSAFYHGVSIITLIVIILNSKGYFTDFNKAHLHNFSRYLFMLGMVWAYMWFMQYILIWFANIHEETVYYVDRITGKWSVFFYLNIILNWAIPFILLLSGKADRNKKVVMIVCIILIIGQWVDLFLQIMPGSVNSTKIGYVELGSFAGYLGLFILIVNKALSHIPLIPKNHPYLEESIKHS